MTKSKKTTKLPQPKTCACGARGTWQPSRVVFGFAEEKEVVWAGCEFCRGSAVGPAVSKSVFMRAPKWIATEAS